MEATTETIESRTEDIKNLIEKQRTFFASNVTKSVEFRKKQLIKLKELIEQYEEEIVDALYQDLRKHEFEAFATEIGIIMVELDKTISKINKWSTPRKVSTPLFHFKANSYIKPEPYGNTLIISPWNYPFQLLFAPLIGAMAAGNTAILKPSEYAPATSKIAAKIINDHFDPAYLALVEGGIPESQALLAEKFDYIFFTGGTSVGKIIYQAAAKHLTPVTLELGGKSPCIIDKDTHLNYTAKRIVWGKFVNAGQTCIAPDYILVDRNVKDQVIDKLKEYITKFYGEDAQASDSYPRIINHRHFDRLNGYIQAEQDHVIFGGKTDRDDKFIGPTLLEGIGLDVPVMKEEIFGPILPIIVYDNIEEAIDLIKSRSKPLALYMFSKNNAKIKKVLSETSAGGVTINDTLMHIANPALPFGGVGDSGIGGYHGQHSFDLFSHHKSVLHRSFLIEEPIRYAPYKLGRKWLKKIMDWAL
ncbi:MAG: aldehyde dehydrogenase [Aureispira sp.]|nr:aldehyde dehydrogenase [Aureispira sp.]